MNDVLLKLLRELLEGPPQQYCFVLNQGDPGLLRSLDALSAADASRIPPGRRSSVAAHLDHLRYGLSLGNGWARGDETTFATAQFADSWTKTTVDDEEWARRLLVLPRSVAQGFRPAKTGRSNRPSSCTREPVGGRDGEVRSLR